MSKPEQENSSQTRPDEGVDFARVAEQSRQIVADFMARHNERLVAGDVDPMNVSSAFFEMAAQMMANPARLAQAQMSLWQDHMALWQHATERMMGVESAPLIEPHKDDRRFRDSEWNENLLFDYFKQSYLLTARWLHATVDDVEGLDRDAQHKIDFYTRQFVDAIAPSNFALTNPEVIRATRESRGENLIRGLHNLLDDLEKGGGHGPAIRMIDENAFKIGENIAISPGKVIHRTDLAELIQYSPTTEQVHARPLLIVTPWINKYYILDLRPENSFIRWAVGQGFTLFVVSWANPDEALADKEFVDYMHEGPLAALDAIEQATGQRDVTAIGYCLGGTLLATTLAYMAATKDTRIKAATFFTSLVDFTEAGDLRVFVDEDQVAALEKQMAEKGYLEAEAMAKTFNMLRANDLIWSFVVNNYLLGRDPLPFDLLYWNSDSTRMPAKMHSFYLRRMYMENLLAEPGGISLDGVPIELGKVAIPSYILAAKEDHIAPWTACYAATHLMSGPTRFVLAASGHVAGVINPPVKAKYGYRTGQSEGVAAQDWLDAAESHDGSWWPDWAAWLKRRSGKKVAARTPGEGKLKVLADAPGEYILK